MVGTKCTFVRVPGCNKDCAFCDTDWKVRGQPLPEVWRPSKNIEWIWLTGGEPLWQDDVKHFVDLWRKEGWKVAVETNGTLPLPTHFDHVVVSPKGNWSELNIHEADDLKVVVPAFRLSEYSGFRAKYRFVQPVWGSYKNIKDIHVPYGWRLSLQNHKYWGVR